MTKWWLEAESASVLRAVILGLALAVASNGPVRAQDAAAEDQPAVEASPDDQGGDKEATDAEAKKAADAGIDQIDKDFNNYLHFALVGKFDIADSFAKALLANPELQPELTDAGAARLLALTDKYENSIETLIIIINNSTIGENAARILDLIREAHRRQRMDPSRIKRHIAMLAGDPMERSVGLERLIESGEYAVPWMLRVLADPKQARLHPFVMRALPRIGRPAIGPLVVALSMPDDVLQPLVAEALGKIGYPQALPYLQRLAADPKASELTRAAAAAAIDLIVVADPAVMLRSAAESFRDLAEQYYAELDAVQPEPGEQRVNVWSYHDEAGGPALVPIEVPREIYGLVMCMRCCKASLELTADQPAVVALWLAANFRREARLGMDVTSEEPAPEQALDATRPQDWPRSIYFARSAGPAYCQRVLTRAIKDVDRDVALGAIAALSVTAGPAAMIDPASPGGMGLPAALFFPDLLVRLKAALALAQAMPVVPFRGDGEVVPVLASALTPADKQYYLLVEPDDALREVIEGELERAGGTVAADARFGPALNKAHETFTHLDGIFLASDMERPTAAEAVSQLMTDDRFALAPVVVFVKKSDTFKVDQIKQRDDRVGFVLLVGGGPDDRPDPRLATDLLAKRDATGDKYGYEPLGPEQGLSLALESAAAIGRIAASHSTVFDAGVAEPALIVALREHPAEDLRIAAAQTLAELDSEAAQRAIAAVALSTDQSESMRVAAFGSLADSARRFGDQLDEAMTTKLLEQATREPNLTLRTAASQALGAMNLPGNEVARIIIGSPATDGQ